MHSSTAKRIINICFDDLCETKRTVRLNEKISQMRDFFEATIGFEPMMRVLQTLALPLGHVAMMEAFAL